jgi:metal-responsive CopG/Arc/MetJ family transcriptional regulator
VGRPSLGLRSIMVRLPTKLIDRIKRLKVNRSALIREAVEEKVTKIEKDLKKSKD